MTSPGPGTPSDHTTRDHPEPIGGDQRSDDMAGADVTNGEGAFDPADADAPDGRTTDDRRG